MDMLTRLEKGLRLGGGLYAVEDIRAALRDGSMQAWLGDQACVVTQLQEFPRKRVLHIVVACGRLDAVLALQPQLETFARRHGCELMTAGGRPGWDKIGPQVGWRRVGAMHVHEVGTKT